MLRFIAVFVTIISFAKAGDDVGGTSNAMRTMEASNEGAKPKGMKRTNSWRSMHVASKHDPFSSCEDLFALGQQEAAKQEAAKQEAVNQGAKRLKRTLTLPQQIEASRAWMPDSGNLGETESRVYSWQKLAKEKKYDQLRGLVEGSGRRGKSPGADELLEAINRMDIEQKALGASSHYG